MSDKLPEQVSDIDIIRIIQGEGKRCYCHSPRFVLREDTRTVYCRQCGAQMDAYRALERLARGWDEVNAQVHRLLKERQELLDWQPHRILVKEINDTLTHRATQNMIPVCPHCGEGIEYQELLQGDGWIGVWPRGNGAHGNLRRKEGISHDDLAHGNYHGND
jgi:hypothetical protein